MVVLTVRRTWLFFLTIAAFCAPLIFAGSFTDARILPGLPVAALMVVPIGAAACLFAYLDSRWHGVGSLLGRLGDFRRTSPPAWHLVSALLMPGVLWLEYASMTAAGRNVPPVRVVWSEIPLLIVLFLVSAALEEIAWTGLALEPLRMRYGPLTAALIIGLVWASLHAIPYAQVQSSQWAVGQSVFSVAFRILLVWLYIAAGDSLFATVLCHASYNVAWQLFPDHGSAYDPWIAAGIVGALALVLILAPGSIMQPGRPPRSVPG